MKLAGVPASGGRAYGRILVWIPPASVMTAPTGSEPLAQQRLSKAITAARQELSQTISHARTRLGDEQAAIFEVQAALLEDPEWVEPIVEQIALGVAPEAAVAQCTEDLAADIRAIPNDYLQQRATDFLDLGQRVLRLLRPSTAPSLVDLLEGTDVILAAHDLTPSETLALEPGVVKAILTETGGRTSHTAILARQLGIPAVVGISGLLDAVREGLAVAVDGDLGYCDLEPADGTAQLFAAEATTLDPPLRTHVRTADGAEIHVLANAATPEDVRRAVHAGADGIGLYRTEFLFVGHALPNEAEQEAVYREAAEAAGGRPITFRTLDVGGDKDAPLLDLEQELNPFLGVRGVRFSLSRPGLFSAQLRALARTADRYPNVRVMVPMVTVIEELDLVRALIPDSPVSLGAMVEVPSAAILAPELAQVADFFSVGTNDLTQYVLAVDRTNDRLSSLYDELHPAVLRLLAGVAIAAAAAGIEAGVCGELAGRPSAAALLVGLGYRHLSVASPRVQGVKRDLAATRLTAAEDLARQALASTSASDVARLLQSG